MSLSRSAALARHSASFLWLCTFVLIWSCKPKQPTRFEVVVKVEGHPGNAMAAAELSLDGRALAKTDTQGSATLRLFGTPGEIQNVRVSCPSGYRSPERPLPIVLRPLLDKRKPEYRARCRPLLQNIVVAVRAQKAGNLPLRYLGREVARTDEAGTCHALLKLPAGETATLTLDTSAPEHARLLPRNPELKITVPERDELVIFDQTFTRDERKARPRPKKEPVGPIRI